MSSKSIFIIIGGIVFLQLIFIGYLVKSISNKKNPPVAVSPIEKDTMIFPQDGGLKHFYEPKPNSVINNNPDWSEHGSVNEINSDSLNDRYDYDVVKKENTFRIITLGDSMTYGLYLDTSDNWTELLEDKLNNTTYCKSKKSFEVINLGVSGYDIKYTLERFNKRGKKYDPDLALWFLIERNISNIVELFHERYNFFDQDASYPSIAKDDSSFAKKERQYHEENKEKILDYQTTAMRTLMDELKGRLVVFSSKSLLRDDTLKIITDETRNKGVLFEPEIGKLTVLENIVTEGDPHPNERGSELIAEDLLKLLNNKNLIPCD